MKHWETWQKIVAGLIATIALLGTLYAFASEYVGLQRDVQELSNKVEDLSTPASAKADMCVELNRTLASNLSAGDTTAAINLEAQMEKMGCYALAVSVENGASDNAAENALQE